MSATSLTENHAVHQQAHYSAKMSYYNMAFKKTKRRSILKVRGFSTPKSNVNKHTPYSNAARRTKSPNRKHITPDRVRSERKANNKPSHNDYIASDYSTPTTTRGRFNHDRLLNSNTPRTRRTPQLVYRPLELDNETSSESTDSFAKVRCQRPKEVPLAIKGAEINYSPKSSSFVPGNFDIQEVLKLYGSTDNCEKTIAKLEVDGDSKM